MTPNGNHSAILEAEQQALAQQDEIPPLYVPPTADKPKALAPFSPEWLDANVQAQQQLVNQRYADWQQSLGALNTLVAMRDLAMQQQAKPD